MKKVLLLLGVIIVIAGVVIISFGNKAISKDVQSGTVYTGSSGGSQDKIKTISSGEEVRITDYLVKGKVVVFDFYADWCGPCKALAPKVEALVKENKNVLLRKINIVNWSSPVAKQYQIQFVPNVRVYDKNGKLMGEPTPNYMVIEDYINKAAR